MLLLTVVYGILSVITWSAFVYKVRDLFADWRDREVQLLCLAISTFAMPFVLASPHVYILIDRLLGVPNIASLIIYMCVAICLTSFVSLLVSWATAEDKVRIKHLLLVAYSVITLVVMVVFFFLGNVDGSEHPIDFDVHFEAVAYISVFLLSYQLLFTLSMGMLVVLCRRYARIVGEDKPWLRRGLRVVTAGAVFGLGYSVPKVLNMVWDLFSPSPLHYVSSILAPMSASAAAALFAVGFTMPAWGSAVGSANRVAADVRAYRRLYPLWSDLSQQFPSKMLVKASPRVHRWSVRNLHRLLGKLVIELHGGSLALRRRDDPEVQYTLADLDFLIQRMVIEIRDGEMELYPHFTAEQELALRADAAAAGLADADADASVKAGLNAAALAAHTAGEAVPTRPAVTAADDLSGGFEQDDEDDLEVVQRIAAAYSGSPVVAAARARTALGRQRIAA